MSKDDEKMVLNRNAENGKFVSQNYAKRHPEITEREIRPAHPKATDRTIVLNRNSENGQFVTPTYVRRHPDTTEREVRRVPSTRTRRGR
jgi:hypothetical protein